MNEFLQFHTFEPSPRFKCITMWRIIHQTGCAKHEALDRMNVKERPYAACYACDEVYKSISLCHTCPITWPTPREICASLQDDYDLAETPESRMRTAEPILDACASWVPEPTDEVFLPIRGYKNIYEVSNFGRVKSLERYCKCNGGIRKISERILKHTLNDHGFATVTLHNKGHKKTHNVHSLVWQSHIETPQGFDPRTLTYSRLYFREGNSPALHNLYRVMEKARLTQK